MNQYFIILALLAVCVHAQTKHCCFPDQWQGLQVIRFGSCGQKEPDYVQAYQMVYYDYTNKRHAIFMNDTARGHKHLILDLFDQLTEYRQDLSTGECHRFKLESSMEKGCIPDSATPVDKPFYYGAGTQKVKAQRYKFLLPPDDLIAFQTVEPDQCIPINMVAHGIINPSNPEGAMMNVEYNNMETRIVNPDVFKVPVECQQAVDEPAEVSPHIMRQFPFI